MLLTTVLRKIGPPQADANASATARKLSALKAKLPPLPEVGPEPTPTLWQRWTLVPNFDDYVDASRATLLTTVIVGLLGVLLVALGLSLMKPGAHFGVIALVYSGLFAVHVGTLWLIRRKRLFAAAFGYSVFAWVTVSLLSGLLGGLSGQHASSFVVVVLVAGFCLGGRWGIVFAFLSVLSAGTLVYLQQHNRLPDAAGIIGPVDQWQSLTTSLLMAALIINVALSSLDAAVFRARDKERAHRQSLEELNTLQAQSEARARHGNAVGMIGQQLIHAQSTQHFYASVTRVIAETLNIDVVAILDRQERTNRVHVLEAFGANVVVGSTLNTRMLHDSVREILEGKKPWAILVRVLGETQGLIGDDIAEVGLLMPIPGRDLARGIVWIASKESRSFPDADRQFLETVAGIIASAMDRDQSETQLRQAQKMEAVGRLAGGIAHDFNNLLTGILGGSELLALDIPASTRQGGLVKDITLAANRAALLTQRILTFSRKQMVRPTTLDLNLVLKEFEGMLRRIIGEQVKLVLALGPGPLPVLADRSNLEQVALNLAVNARDALPTSGGEITLATGRRNLKKPYEALGLEAGRYIWFSVQDTGHGMDEVTQSRVFEPFFTTKDEGKGTGLGLSTVRRVLREAGGEIAVESTLGRGTTFTAFLPEVNEAAARSSLVPLSAPMARRGEVVLVVEDHEIVRKTATAILEHAGYKVEAVSGAVEACARFKDLTRVDLVLSDVVMQDMSGYELRSWLAEHHETIPILLMSGYSEEALTQPEEPAAGFIRKPFTHDALLKKAREVIDSCRPLQVIETAPSHSENPTADA